MKRERKFESTPRFALNYSSLLLLILIIDWHSEELQLKETNT